MDCDCAEDYTCTRHRGAGFVLRGAERPVDPYEVTTRIRNNALLQRRVERGWSREELGRLAAVGKLTIGQYEIFRLSPIAKNGEWKESALKLAKAFGVEPDVLWSPLSREIMNPVVVRTVGEEQLAAIRAHEMERLLGEGEQDPEALLSGQQRRAAVSRALGLLNSKERAVMSMWYGLDGSEAKTQEEIAELFGVSRNRIHQIAAKALRKLRHPGRIRAAGLKEVLPWSW